MVEKKEVKVGEKDKATEKTKAAGRARIAEKPVVKTKKKTTSEEWVAGGAKKKASSFKKVPKFWQITLRLLAFVAWVAVVLLAAQYLVAMLLNLALPTETLLKPITNMIYGAVVYLLAFLVIVFVPWKLIKMKTTRDELGVRGLPTWTDILLAPVGLIVAMLLGGIILMIIKCIFPAINLEQEQELGFNNLFGKAELIEGFIALVVVAPIAEELIFRGWLYGKMRARAPMWPALILCSLLFGFMHGQVNVGVVTFAMSVVMCLIRELTGTIWSGVLLHMIKNGVAFYLLYVLGVA